MRIVLDTNVLLVSIPRNSKYRFIFDKFLSKEYTLIICNEILSEYAEIIEQKSNSIVSTNIVEMLMSAVNVEKQEVFFKWQLIDSDKDDNKFADCAVAGNADYLVTNDRHFSIIKTVGFPPISIISIDEFLDILKNK
jgi:putative PIN family toxin of toxin-antitoxin system